VKDSLIMKKDLLDEEKYRVNCANHIFAIARAINVLNQSINDYVKIRVPEFHFMTHKISKFWSCAKSPVGVCIFEIDRNGVTQNCFYCHNPEERK
jgi:hypothetical protein